MIRIIYLIKKEKRSTFFNQEFFLFEFVRLYARSGRHADGISPDG